MQLGSNAYADTANLKQRTPVSSEFVRVTISRVIGSRLQVQNQISKPRGHPKLQAS